MEIYRVTILIFSMNFSELSEHYLKKALVLGIKPDDIIEQFIRGSGKGGQKINKTASCVLLKHGPTGIEVRCQKLQLLHW